MPIAYSHEALLSQIFAVALGCDLGNNCLHFMDRKFKSGEVPGLYLALITGGGGGPHPLTHSFSLHSSFLATDSCWTFIPCVACVWCSGGG